MENNAKPVTGMKGEFIKHYFAILQALAWIFSIITFPIFLFIKGLVLLLRLLKR